MRLIKSILLTVCLLFSTSVFANSNTSVEDLKTRMDNFDKALKRINKQISNNYVGAKKMPSEAQNSKANDALLFKIQSLEETIQGLTGDIERLTYEIEQLKEQQKQQNDESGIRFKEIESKITNADRKAQSLIDEKEQIKAAKVEAEKKKKEKDEADAKAKKDKETKIKADFGQKKPDELYKLALSFINVKDPKKKNLKEAERHFEAFLFLYPQHKLAGNAQYWLGETYFSASQFEKAAKTFGLGYEKYSTHEKAPDNLFKLGVTFVKMKELEKACQVFSIFEGNYPNMMAKRIAIEKKNAKCQ